MAQIAVGEGVRGTLEEDNDGMEFAEGADAWVVDVVVDVLCRDVEIGDGVDAVEEGDNIPRRVELTQRGGVFGGRVLVLVLFGGDALVGAVGLPGSGELNQVGDEEMGRNQEVEEQAGDDIGAAVVVAAETYEDAILLQVDNHQSQVGDDYSC